MARPLRIEFEGALYHVTSRGNARGIIFEDDSDRDIFVNNMDRVVKKYRWICHGFCLMGNHYHLLLETPEANLSRGMRQLNGVYTQAFNRRHRRIGHLLQGRYKAILIEKESYLLELCRYIVLNPVAAKMVKHPGEWSWSSYRATVGEALAPAFLHTDWVLGQFGTDRQKAIERFREFVGRGMKSSSPWTNLRGLLLGGSTFIARVEPFLSEHRNQVEVPQVQRLAHRPDLETILCRGNRARDAARAHSWGYTLNEIARFWGIHYSSASRLVKKGEKEVLHCKI